MTFPASVEHLNLISRKGGARKRLQPGEVELSNSGDRNVPIGVGGPVLDHGRPGGVKLERAGRRWGWQWAAENRTELRLQLADKALRLYPGTRPTPRPESDLTVEQRIESAVDYVKAIPDIGEFSSIADLVVEELVAEKDRTQHDDTHRRTLEVVENDRFKAVRKFLVFPTGELGNHLNVSAFLPRGWASRHAIVTARFQAASKSVDTFPTEILQLCSSPVVSTHRIDRFATALLVRLHSFTYMLNLIPVSDNEPDTKLHVLATRVGAITPEETEGRRHVDCAIDPTCWSRALIVDEGGGLWLWWEEKEEYRERLQKVMRLRKLRGPILDKKDPFFRIAFGTRPGTAIVMSERDVVLIDFESSGNPATTLLELSGRDKCFTAIETTGLKRGAAFTCLATTHEVIWIDELKTGPPVLVWRHDYGSGTIKDMELSVVQADAGDCILLSSRLHPLVMAFHVPSTPPIRSLLPPYALSSASHSIVHELCSLTSITLHRGKILQEQTSLLGLASDGSVHMIRFLPTPGRHSGISPRQSGNWKAQGAEAMEVDSDDSSSSHSHSPISAPTTRHVSRSVRRSDIIVEWDDDIRQLAAWQDVKDDDIEEWKQKARTRCKVLDMRWAWQEINEPSQVGETPFSPSVLNRHLRELEAPFDTLVTASDLARDAIRDDQLDSRSQALLALPICEEPSNDDIHRLDEVDFEKYLSVVSRLPGRDLSAGVLKEGYGTGDIRKSLEKAFLPKQKEVSSEQRKRNQKDINHLAIDLALSRIVLASEPIVSPPSPSTPRITETDPNNPDDLFARTEQLSLNDKDTEPPRVKLSFLVPQESLDTPEGSGDDADSDVDGHLSGQRQTSRAESLQRLSVRSLLSEWEIGSDPSEYKWKSWLPGPESTKQPVRNGTAQRPIRPLPNSPRGSQVLSNTQVPSAPPRNAPPAVQPQPQSQAQAQAYSLPLFPPTISAPAIARGNMTRSSPPPRPMSSQVEQSQDYGLGMASTQVERGPFGGRPQGEKVKKKAGKKRVGGF